MVFRDFRVFSRGLGEGRGGCVRNIGHEHDFCQAHQKAESTDPRTNYAVKYATACGHLNYPEGPTIKKIQSRSKCSISIEIFNPAQNFQSRRLDFPTKKIGPRWVARSKISFSLEIFNLAHSLEFFELWALWVREGLPFLEGRF